MVTLEAMGTASSPSKSKPTAVKKFFYNGWETFQGTAGSGRFKYSEP